MNSANFTQLLQLCQQKSIVLSTQQELILQIIFVQQSPMSSSSILEQLIIYNPTANRMTIYRALEYLIEHKLVHKIQSQNTYTICKQISDHSCQILVCTQCGAEVEIHSHSICSALDSVQAEYNFTFANPLEILGLCANCRH